jgi:hypothetical protein
VLQSVIDLPLVGWEDVSVFVIPLPLEYLHQESTVLPHAVFLDKSEEWSFVSTSIVDEEVIEGHVVREDDVFFDAHQRPSVSLLQVRGVLVKHLNRLD